MIQILLATYNGAKYLNAQLDSLLSQTCRRWTLIAHDDVWLPDKIEKTFHKVKVLEGLQASLPIVVHTDLEVVDESLCTIAPSMFEYQGLDVSVWQTTHFNYLQTP